MPTGSVRDSGGNGVAIHTCDPGPAVDLHVPGAGEKTLLYPVGRLQLAVTVLDESKKGTAIPMSAQAAYCFADAVIRIAPANTLTGDDSSWKPDPAQQAEMTGARDSCIAKRLSAQSGTVTPRLSSRRGLPKRAATSSRMSPRAVRAARRRRVDDLGVVGSARGSPASTSA